MLFVINYALNFFGVHGLETWFAVMICTCASDHSPKGAGTLHTPTKGVPQIVF